jgi:hypothetical protein
MAAQHPQHRCHDGTAPPCKLAQCEYHLEHFPKFDSPQEHSLFASLKAAVGKGTTPNRQPSHEHPLPATSSSASPSIEHTSPRATDQPQLPAAYCSRPQSPVSPVSPASAVSAQREGATSYHQGEQLSSSPRDHRIPFSSPSLRQRSRTQDASPLHFARKISGIVGPDRQSPTDAASDIPSSPTLSTHSRVSRTHHVPPFLEPFLGAFFCY